MAIERRRHRRHPCAITVEVEQHDRRVQLVTADISRHGAFVLTENPAPEHDIIRLRFELPDKMPVDVMSLVARNVSPGDAQYAHGPGMGVGFFALSSDAKERWDAFVRNLSKSDRSVPSAMPSVSWGEQSLARRRHTRQRGCFLVRLKRKDELREFYTRDISAGGMFLSTPAPQEAADAIDLILVHPQTEQEFTLSSRTVRRSVPKSAEEPGVAVAFDRLSIAKEAALLAFIETGMNYLDPADDNVERFARLRRSNPATLDSPKTLVAVGESLIAAGDAELAVHAFQSALTLDAHFAKAHAGLALAFEKLHRPAEAAEHRAACAKLTQ